MLKRGQIGRMEINMTRNENLPILLYSMGHPMARVGLDAVKELGWKRL